MKIKLIVFTALLVFACKAQENTDAPYAIGSNDYVALTEQYLTHWSTYDFEALTGMMSDDAEYNFPDGDENTRTKLIGKPAILAWWNDWETNAGVSSMSFSGQNIIPLFTKENQNTTATSGNFALCWVTNTMQFTNGNSVGLRMNLGIHFNDEKLVDRVWSYYDRTPIITAMGGNILQAQESEETTPAE